jgi:hypothetical protein
MSDVGDYNNVQVCTTAAVTANTMFPAVYNFLIYGIVYGITSNVSLPQPCVIFSFDAHSYILSHFVVIWD